MQLYTIAGAFPAYGAQPGELIQLDPSDGGVALNVAAGVLLEGDQRPAPAFMTCPACTGQGVKHPPKFGGLPDLAEHYAEDHPALVVPEWKAA